ncbi:MAG: EboA domain-containing protein [Cyclobacteriaceae bacterium]
MKSNISAYCISSIEDKSAASWFESKLNTHQTISGFFLAFGMISKKISKTPISIDQALESEIKSVDPAFDQTCWTLDQFCRLALLLQLPAGENKEIIEKLLASADMREQVAIFKSLVLLDNASDFSACVVDGIRTNMIDVFDSIAHFNGFAFNYFSEDAWNQMALKAIFMERSIFYIYGIDNRKNQKLADILHDYVHERWSAGRAVNPELWRMISGYMNDEILEDLKKVIATDTETAKAAAIKVITESSNTNATNWLSEKGLAPSEKSWDDIGHEVWLNAQN